MALSVATLGLGREGINQLLWLESDNTPDQAQMVLGRRITTTKEYERMKQFAGYGPAGITPEGERVQYDDLYPVFQRDYRPVKRTKGVKISVEASITDQYGVLARKIPDFAASFMHSKNQAAANIHNNGFTVTTDGMNSETLYATSHAMILGNTFSNRPATDLAFGPIAVQQMLAEIRKQKNARNLPMPYAGKVVVMVPPDYEGNAWILQNSMQQPGTTDNDANFARTRVTFVVCDYFTSTTAWFARTAEERRHGLFQLMQKTYTYMKLPPDDDLMDRHIAYEIYTQGWFDAHGTWGTTG